MTLEDKIIQDYEEKFMFSEPIDKNAEYCLKVAKQIIEYSKVLIRKILQQYKVDKEKALQQQREEICEELKKIEEWPEPKEGAGKELGALAGTGMYMQYDADRKKHRQQIEDVIKIIKEQT